MGSWLRRVLGRHEPQVFDLADALSRAYRAGETHSPASLRQAAELYSQVVSASPEVHVAWFNLGVAQVALGRWKEALPSFSRAQASPDLLVCAAFAAAKVRMENGQQIRDDDLPPEFRGVNRAALGVQGPCHNAANVLRKMGFTCTVDGTGESSSIHCTMGATRYRIDIDDILGQLLKNTYRSIGGKMINLGDAEGLSDMDRQVKQVDVGRLPIVQAPISVGAA